MTDDYEPLAFAIQKARTDNVPVCLAPGKVYAISDDLQVTARIQIYGNGATIKAAAAMEACIFVTSSEGQFPSVNRRAMIRDLTFDCNDLSWSGLDITNVQGMYLDNIDIRYMTKVGLNYRNNFGVFARNIRIAGHNSGTHAGTIVGLRAAGHDSYFTDIVVVDCDIGVQNLGAVTQYDHIHVWTVNPNVIPTSIMFDAHRGFQATNCYLDTCAIGFNINTEWPEFDKDKALSIVNCYILHGGSGSGEHMTPEIMGNVIPCVFHVDDVGWVGKIKASGLINVKPNEAYDLFNLDPGISADYDWLKENDPSIRAMGNVPQQYADNALLGDAGDTDNTPYIKRASGGGAAAHGYERDKLVGGTLAWNQLARDTDTSVTVPNGHRYIACISGAWSVGSGSGAALNVSGADGDMVFDLTQMFGPDIANYVYALGGTDAASWFRKLFPNDHYAYNAGELMSVKASAHEMVGFNQWDEETEPGQLDTNGAPTSISTKLRAKNYTPVLPSTSYYVKTANNTTVYIAAYNADKEFIGYIPSSAGIRSGGSFTTPDHAWFIRLDMGTSYGTVYNNDICVSFSDASRNGEYEPYIKRLYPLDSSLELRGVPKLDASNKLYYDGDTYESGGKVTTKYGIINLGSLSWSRYTDAGANAFFQASVAGRRYGANIRFIPSRFDFITHSSSRYGFTRAEFGNEAADNSIGGLHTNDSIVVRADAYATASAFKAAVDGAYVVFELAAPKTGIAAPFQDPQIVDGFGTEAYVDARDVAIPVGHETRYYRDLRKKLEAMAQIPKPPTENGAYTLAVTVSNGTPEYSWVSE